NLEINKENLSSNFTKLSTEFNELTESLKLPKEIQRIQFTLDERKKEMHDLNRTHFDLERLVQRQKSTLASPDFSIAMLDHKTISQILSGHTSNTAGEITPFCPQDIYSRAVRKHTWRLH
ncbi:hypothetical protein, partial [Pseudomonas viridiflava]|uniref:hypothetical protein n=1 Tax=Pseudomonas viridiflava TaxID=33069 RepID=UPI0013DEABD1